MVRKTAPSHRGAGQQPGIKRLEHAAISHYLLALAVDVNAPLDLTRIIAKSRKLKPVADLDQARSIIKDSTIPASSLEELRALWSGTFPSLATAATMSLVLKIPDPIPEMPAPSGPQRRQRLCTSISNLIVIEVEIEGTQKRIGSE